MNRSAFAWLLFGVFALAACDRPSSKPSGPVGNVGVATPAPGCAAQSSLDDLDTRIAVPLLPMMANHQKRNMRDHLVAVQEIALAASHEDFAAVERAAGRLGYSPEMGKMCTRMGAGAPGFTEQALAFHHTADSIAVAARQHDHAAVVRALGTTLAACTGCHETYRQRVVDEATWSRLTSMAAPTGHQQGG